MDQSRETRNIKSLIENIELAIKGKRDVVTLIVLTLAARGHVLIEDPPGAGKTVLAKALARSIDGVYRRVQCTPDLLPSDITGSQVYHPERGSLDFVEGPIFANVVLIDELNRATPRTQSALLEAMEERQITTDRTTIGLPEPFFVIATQNPREQFGTYDLPESELDRFMATVSLGFPDAETEHIVVRMQLDSHPVDRVDAVVTPSDVKAIQAAVRSVHIEDDIVSYAVGIVRRVREHENVYLGPSPRASIGLIALARARAVCEGRPYVIPDDVKEVLSAVLSHRVIIHGGNGSVGDADRIIQEVVRRSVVPVRY